MIDLFSLWLGGFMLVMVMNCTIVKEISREFAPRTYNPGHHGCCVADIDFTCFMDAFKQQLTNGCKLSVDRRKILVLYTQSRKVDSQ